MPCITNVDLKNLFCTQVIILHYAPIHLYMFLFTLISQYYISLIFQTSYTLPKALYATDQCVCEYVLSIDACSEFDIRKYHMHMGAHLKEKEISYHVRNEITSANYDCIRTKQVGTFQLTLVIKSFHDSHLTFNKNLN